MTIFSVVENSKLACVFTFSARLYNPVERLFVKGSMNILKNIRKTFLNELLDFIFVPNFSKSEDIFCPIKGEDLVKKSNNFEVCGL